MKQRAKTTSELGLLDDDQLTAVDYGLDVPQPALLVSVTEVMPQGGFLIGCSEVRHGPCFDAPQVNHGTIVPANAHGLLRSDITE
ncbi:hypothetical protein [Streptomyces sp. NPDC020377]|uniref:hypothetical protein n=1 Tax=Streptomyces sp. NPDC020377 TaxID=3365070 RepID=UPI0037898F0E